MDRFRRRDVALAGGILVLQPCDAASVERKGALRLDAQGGVEVGDGRVVLVSYTHLDVYKRQVLDRAVEVAVHAMADAAIVIDLGELLAFVARRLDHGRAGVDALGGAGAVLALAQAAVLRALPERADAGRERARQHDHGGETPRGGETLPRSHHFDSVGYLSFLPAGAGRAPGS